MNPLSLESRVQSLRCPPELVPAILKEAEAIQQQSAHPESPNGPVPPVNGELDTIVREAADIILERQEPTVLLSIADPALRKQYLDLFTNKAVIRLLNEPADVEAYVRSRPSSRFNLIAVIGQGDQEKETPRRFDELQKIIGGNQQPLIACLHQGANYRTELAHAGDKKAEELPRSYRTVMKIIDRVLNGQRPNVDTPDRGTPQSNMAWLHALLEATPNDSLALIQLAQGYERKRRFDEAIRTYEQVLELHPDHFPAHLGRANALLSQWPDSPSLFRFTFQEKVGLEGMIANLRTHTQYESDPTLDYLLGKSMVLSYIDQERHLLAPTTEQTATADLHPLGEAIKLLTNAYTQNRHNVDSCVYLALAHALRGLPGDFEEAYRHFQATLRFSDPLTEPLMRGTLNEADIFSADRDAPGTRILQFTGLHRVFRLGTGQIVLKRYERRPSDTRRTWERPGEGLRSRIEQRNITYCHDNTDRLIIRAHGQEQHVETPPWSLLVESTTGDSIFEIMPYLAGRNVAEHFEQLDEMVAAQRVVKSSRRNVGKRLPQVKPRNQPPPNKTKPLTDEIKMKHLEWITDSCAAFQIVCTKNRDGSRREGLKDVRTMRYTVDAEPGKPVDVDYYTKRVFEKLVDTFAKVVPDVPMDESRYAVLRKRRVELTPTERQRLIGLIAPIGDLLRSAPDWLYVAYTDNNIRNYSVQCTTSPPQEEDYALRSIKKRFDLENEVIILGTSDALTAVEHELADIPFGQNYLMNRWLASIALGMQPATDPNSPAYDIDATRRLTAIMGKVDQSYRGKEKRQQVKDALKHHLRKTSPEFGLKEYQDLVPIDSLMRHLTIICDKVRDAFRVQATVGELEKKFGLEKWRPLHTYKQEARILKDRQEDSDPRYACALLHGVLEDLDRYHSYHQEKLADRLRTTKSKELDSFLKKHYRLTT